jgi:hypothetical protein
MPNFYSLESSPMNNSGTTFHSTYKAGAIPHIANKKAQAYIAAESIAHMSLRMLAPREDADSIIFAILQ